MPKLSSAEPQIARYQPSLAKKRIPLEEDVIRKSGVLAVRETRISDKIANSSPSSANRTLFTRDIVKEKKLIVLSKDDKEEEIVLIIKKSEDLDAGIELTPIGPQLYVRDEKGISKMELPRFFLLEVNLKEAVEILKHRPPEARVYAVLMDGYYPRIEKASPSNLRKMLKEGLNARLFLGHYEWVDWEKCVEKVRFEP